MAQLNMDPDLTENKNDGSSSSNSNRQQPYEVYPSQFFFNTLNAFHTVDTDIPICIFMVPDSLKDSNPKAYSPQVVGLGLLHQPQSKFALMQMQKLDVAKKIHNGFGKIDFSDLINNLIYLIPSARACYSIYLQANNNDMACALAIDALFLFALLCYHGVGKDELAKSDILRGLVDTVGTRLTQDGILRDTMMLENQIPFIVLKNILLIECPKPSHVASKKKSEPNSSHAASKKKNTSLIIDSSEPNSSDVASKNKSEPNSSHAASKKKNKSPIIECSEPNASNVASKKKKKWSRSFVEKHLPPMLLGYCKAVSPLQVPEKYPVSIVLKHAHLLDLLYNLIMLKEPPQEEAPKEEEEEEEEDEEEEKEEEEDEEEEEVLKYAYYTFPGMLGNVAGIGSALDIPNDIKPPIELVKGLLELPWSELGLSSIKNIVHVEEEIMIPTASKLSNVGVKFLPDHITAIGFDPDETKFKLPKIKLDVNSEVIIRNLVAYESLSKSESESLVFTRYFELMNAIIQTTKDVKVLRDHGILQSESMKDEEVVKIFSGTSKPLRLANAEDVDNAIAEVNEYYNGFRRVKARKFVKKCVFTLWNGRTLFAAILLLSLMALQTFCSVYGCSRLFNKTN